MTLYPQYSPELSGILNHCKPAVNFLGTIINIWGQSDLTHVGLEFKSYNYIFQMSVNLSVLKCIKLPPSQLN